MCIYLVSKRKDFPDLVLSHFASLGGSNTNYFYAIYTILTKIREHLNIKQKVELLEERLRKKFSYWLDVASRKLE